MEFKPSQALSISVLNQDNEQRFYWIEDNEQIQTIYEASDRDSDRHKLSKKIRSFEGKYSRYIDYIILSKFYSYFFTIHDCPDFTFCMKPTNIFRLDFIVGSRFTR